MASFFSPFYVLCIQVVFAADTTIFSFDTPPKHFLSTGLVTGKTAESLEQTRFFGLDTSYIIADDGRWFGVASDVIYDGTQHTTSISVAPRIGWYVLGMDAGVTMRFSSEQKDLGYQIRGLFTLGYVSGFYRYTLWSDSSKNPKSSHQTGIVLKMPISISKGHKTSKEKSK